MMKLLRSETVTPSSRLISVVEEIVIKVPFLRSSTRLRRNSTIFPISLLGRTSFAAEDALPLNCHR